MSFFIKYRKPINAFLIILFAGILCTSIYRDYKNLQEGYPCDLRKRIVGARYMAKGYSPYFFKWTSGYPAELCLQYEGDSTFKQNIVTLPPGYTWLLQPLSTLQFPVIEKIWFAFQYLSILLIFSIFYFKTSNKTTLNLLLLLYSFLLLSKAWSMNMYIGQSYILFPLLLSAMYIFFHKHPKSLFYYGLTVGILIWLRPSYVFFALPFLFAENKKLFFKGLFIMAAICLLQIILFNQYQHWIDFFKSSKSWIEYYSQRHSDHGVHFDMLIVPKVIETQTNFYVDPPLPAYIANIPFELRAIFNIYASSTVYSLIFLSIAAIFFYIFFYKNKLNDPTLLLISGFCLNYLSEVFIWLPKCDYYFVELFFPLCLLIYNQHKVNKKILIIIFIGLFFSAYLFKVVPMQLLLGEYLIAGSLFLYLFSTLKKK
ncbi:glycosyltransferase 87 family protein [Ferruginibacter sp.]|uniref:glycosyltransferase 87 family protein n=1 Tax=Ferruginibacter sp. TaxID=1940288 RepID=UPI00265B4290|nr:glycosyltransferase 87 family protein [Ferruginibacter sp.]